MLQEILYVKKSKKISKSIASICLIWYNVGEEIFKNQYTIKKENLL